MGHHFVPRRVGGRWNLPQRFMESRFNVMRPRGISIGRFYERHFRADRLFHGTRFPRAVGGTWSGRAAGLQKPGLAGRLWYASPGPLKAAVGVGAVGAGAGAYWWLSDDE